MTKIYKIKEKSTPQIIKDWFVLNFPKCTFQFYYYKMTELQEATPNNKVYGCLVFENGKFIHNATQARISWFIKNKNLNKYN